MKYKIIYKNGNPSGPTKQIQEQAWQMTAQEIVDNYAKLAPSIHDVADKLVFVLDYATSKMTLDESSMSQELISKINEAHSKNGQS